MTATPTKRRPPRPIKRSPDDLAKIMRELATSAAAAPDGCPVYHTVSRSTGVDRRTLRRWWDRLTPRERLALQSRAEQTPADKTTPADKEAPASGPDPTALLPWACRMLGLVEATPRAEALAELRVERDACGSDTARARLTEAITRRITEWGVATGSKGGVPTPDEWIEQARQAPELLLEAVVGCPEALGDERLWEAVDAARGEGA